MFGETTGAVRIVLRLGLGNVRTVLSYAGSFFARLSCRPQDWRR